MTGCIFFLLTGLSAIGQLDIEEKLRQHISNARSDSEKIVRLGQLSQFYYANKDFERGDSLIEKQIILAEASMNQNLVILAYFGNVGYLSTGASTRDRSGQYQYLY
jgi:hypothetical protein